MTNVVTGKKKAILKVTIYWAVFYILFIAVTSQSGVMFSKPVHRFTSAILGTLIALLVTGIFIKSENKILADYNLAWRKSTLLNFFKGLTIGAAAYATIILILVLFGGLQIQKNPEAPSLWTAFLYLAIVPAAFMEEIAFRSYPFIKLNQAFGLRITQAMVVIAFALYHIPLGWSILSAFLGPGIWALVFGIAAVQSKGIALPTGIHVGLNLIQSIFGLSKGIESFWLASQDENTSSFITNLVTRMLVLLAGILLTEYSIRSSSDRQPAYNFKSKK